MKPKRLVSFTGVLGLALLAGFSLPGATPEGAPLPATTIFSPDALMSPAVRGVVKMVRSGVSEDVVRVYVENAPAPFNVSADDIIRLGELGVSPALTTSMLKHDRALRDNPNIVAATTPAPAPPANQAAVTAPLVPGAVGSPASDEVVYNNLAPYGYWNDVPGYGWNWQPYSWLGYNYYPWFWLGFGSWANCPGRGWCWFPHSHFQGFNQFHAAHGSLAVTRVGGGHGATVHVAGRTGGASFTAHGGTVARQASVGVRSSPWVSSFGRGVSPRGSGTFHGSVGGGFRGVASAGFHGGSGGSFHGGGGGGVHAGGGSHGGGGHH